jgi:hypothetical protein
MTALDDFINAEVERRYAALKAAGKIVKVGDVDGMGKPEK